MIPLRLIRKTTWGHPYGIEWLVSPEGLENPNAQIILYDLGYPDDYSTITDEHGNVYTFNPATTERYDDGTFAIVSYQDPLPCPNDPNPTKQNSPSSTPS